MDWLAEARNWLATFVAVLVAWVAGRSTMRAKIIEAESAERVKRLDVTAAPYSALAARVEVLETQVGKLRARVEHLEDENESLHERAQRMLAHVKRVHDWLDAGAPPPPPVRPSWAGHEQIESD